jgi:hypothetical protein
LIAPAWQYFYLHQAIEANTTNETEIVSNFKSLVAQANKVQYSAFEQSFFNFRKFLRENCFDYWLSLHDKYPFFDYIKPVLASSHPITPFILSTKDEETISTILEVNKVEFPSSRILGKSVFEKYGNKAETIKEIMNEYSGCEAVFIDDSHEHLCCCNGIDGLITIQNDWGYVEPGVGQLCNYNSVVSMLNQYKGEVYECT